LPILPSRFIAKPSSTVAAALGAPGVAIAIAVIEPLYSAL